MAKNDFLDYNANLAKRAGICEDSSPDFFQDGMISLNQPASRAHTRTKIFIGQQWKATNSKNRGKINKLLPIMQEHLGKSMNLARIKLMTLLLEALGKAQTVSLVRLANAMPTAADKESNMRRLQRFLAGYALNLDLIARMIFSLLPVKHDLVLTMDRTNWKYGKTDINVLLLGATYKNVAFPLLFRLLPKRGNSNTPSASTLLSGSSVCSARTA